MAANSNELIQAGAMHRSDLPLVGEMERRNYEFPWSENIFRDCLKAGYTCQVLRHGSQLMGYGILQVGADEAHILNLCIDKPFQRQGLARRLLNRLIKLSELQGAHTVFLEARPSNPRAIELYLQSGFNEIGVRRGYYDAADGREDALIMALALSGASR